MLYKFRTANINNICSLFHNELFFSHVDKFNDPFEFHFEIDMGLPHTNCRNTYYRNFKNFIGKVNLAHPNTIDDSLVNMIMSINEDKVDEVSKAVAFALKGMVRDRIEQLREQFKIFCMSKSNKHPLLWGHYADGLRGYCVGYDEEKLVEADKIGLLNVSYSNKPHQFKIDELLRGEFENKGREIFGVKLLEWQYEEEARLIVESESLFDNVIKAKNEALKEVIFGEKMDMKLIELVRNLLDGRRVSFFKALSNPENYTISITPLT